MSLLEVVDLRGGYAAADDIVKGTGLDTDALTKKPVIAIANSHTEMTTGHSHLASLARERGIPMVLGVLDATSRIPDGSQVAVDGVAGVVRWMS